MTRHQANDLIVNQFRSVNRVHVVQMIEIAVRYQEFTLCIAQFIVQLQDIRLM